MLRYRKTCRHTDHSEMIAIKNDITMKGRRIIIPAALQDKALKQLHLKHVGIVKTGLLACESIYWINKNADIEETVKNAHFP